MSSDAETSAAADAATRLWFAGKDVDILLYRINRRPLPSGETLMAQPTDILEHLQEVLRNPRSVGSGRRYQRTWRVGNAIFDDLANTVTGRIGWLRSGETLATDFNEETQSWEDIVVASDFTAVAPFTFVADGRYLGILKHPTFAERTVAEVFTRLLNAGEQARPAPTTNWGVDPIGSEARFYEWVDRVDTVTRVKFVFQRPNPDAQAEFAELFDRLDALKAREIKDEVVAADPEEGLDKQALRTEPETRAYIAAASAAFGFVVGNGISNRRKVRFDQRQKGVKERLHGAAGSWSGIIDQMIALTRSASDRRPR